MHTHIHTEIVANTERMRESENGSERGTERKGGERDEEGSVRSLKSASIVII